MKRIEYQTTDKSDWERGPWDNEPDKVQYQDPETGLPCLIVRGPHGSLCGYVGVSEGHPWHGKDYDDVGMKPEKPHGYDDDWWVDVHGGLTFAGPCQEGEKAKEHGICHIVEEGEDDNVWWLGFDCAHSGDKTGQNYPPDIRAKLEASCADIPGYNDYRSRDVYRDVAYVEGEIARLAKQAAEVAGG